MDRDRRCKVADFGLAREMDAPGFGEEPIYSSQGARKLPVHTSYVTLFLDCALGELC